MDISLLGDVTIVGDPRRTTTDEGGQPTEFIGREGGGTQVAEEEGVVDTIECLREVDGGNDGTKRQLSLVKAIQKICKKSTIKI